MEGTREVTPGGVQEGISGGIPEEIPKGKMF